MAQRHRPHPSPAPPRHRLLALLGPAFVAAVAYVDPGNVAANVTAGARYGYLLVWVLVLANAMAVLIQYQSAKLGIVTGRSLPQALRPRMRPASRIAFFLQAELVAIATDLAEVIGGAIALHLLFGLPLLAGGCIVGVVSIGLLLIQERRSQRTFEGIVVGLLVIITIGFVGGLFVSPPDWGQTAAGLIPRLRGADSLLVAASMLGATVMPHAIYLHSSLVRDHHDEIGEGRAHRDAAGAKGSRTGRLIHATRVDVVWALAVAGCVNIALLLLAASALAGVEGTDTIEGAHAAITESLGSGVGIVFAVGLLASGLASTSVGAYAGSEIMQGLLDVRVPIIVQRVITLIPALVIIALGSEPTWALVVSQVVLSFGIPFAIVPLMRLTGSEQVMGRWRDGVLLRWVSRVVAAVIIVLNIALLWLTLSGQG
ncbi:MAG: Nramp family divalent metal transporter [Actinomyces urogenitalis]|uniref:Nramp family divalent metal transporter n=1 Tax=Actinomyces urogenitalis TaxID=103621 RepID=UPI00058D9342|nr:Nramp family divalent metal transporter [Actinomyces urogenitalis]MBS5976954.1 Nramp family divalent metal transporter [Actinomyces urogenitalis]MBS6072243.1 Nramp family divalent metal transporter [Actinomyces urogenitalis]MDK8237472.1 Nramp family divalent metal transporter [Actinomyces urogenitalis]MDK8834763.1 Nramp family divalent metal transporter [Actinomyces urogenitalis]MDU0864395.1 Nramp family divalent metal transporter [Actinomyces urogenitalis]